MSSFSRKIHTKEMICCVFLIIVGCLTTFSYSTAVSASHRSTSNAAETAIHSNNTNSNSNRAKNFNSNGILRDDDAVPVSVSTSKSHKKQINGGNDDFNVNGRNGDGAHSPHNAANYFDNDNDGNTMAAAVLDDSDSDTDSDFISIEVADQLSLKDQMRLFTEQMTKRFQHELKVAVRKTAADLFKADFQSQLEQLRYVYMCMYIVGDHLKSFSIFNVRRRLFYLVCYLN